MAESVFEILGACVRVGTFIHLPPAATATPFSLQLFKMEPSFQFTLIAQNYTQIIVGTCAEFRILLNATPFLQYVSNYKSFFQILWYTVWIRFQIESIIECEWDFKFIWLLEMEVMLKATNGKEREIEEKISHIYDLMAVF